MNNSSYGKSKVNKMWHFIIQSNHWDSVWVHISWKKIAPTRQHSRLSVCRVSAGKKEHQMHKPSQAQNVHVSVYAKRRLTDMYGSGLDKGVDPFPDLIGIGTHKLVDGSTTLHQQKCRHRLYPHPACYFLKTVESNISCRTFIYKKASLRLI